ncbi:hypothetical protein N752_14780 [Desulforamulus aquiferis]|nr:hypothetical protein N752_14780 [Desulforamulus aquiferis]
MVFIAVTSLVLLGMLVAYRWINRAGPMYNGPWA